ncbi:MAG: hypothetical protein K0Q82_2126 [Chryseobacterium indoltheticum]|jgi:hypothetical protein|nr:hypothetical protein [Chryseobacterium indoltheticum]
MFLIISLLNIQILFETNLTVYIVAIGVMKINDSHMGIGILVSIYYF